MSVWLVLPPEKLVFSKFRKQAQLLLQPENVLMPVLKYPLSPTSGKWRIRKSKLDVAEEGAVHGLGHFGAIYTAVCTSR